MQPAPQSPQLPGTETLLHLTQNTSRNNIIPISARAAGTAVTTATWIRNVITSHSEYKQDSVVSDGIQYDLIITASEISMGKRECTEMISMIPKTKTSEDIPKALKKLIQMTCLAQPGVAPPNAQ